MNFIVDAIGRSGLLRRDLDYHLLRASMVIIFAWFGYDKWFESEIKGLVPLIHPRAVYFLDDSGLGDRRHKRSSRSFRMDLWFATATGILEQETGCTWRSRFLLHLHCNLYDFAIRS
ncbi:hypothetical protein ACVWZR_007528 [Bradyrhizobium sp. i1.3.1]